MPGGAQRQVLMTRVRHSDAEIHRKGKRACVCVWRARPCMCGRMRGYVMCVVCGVVYVRLVSGTVCACVLNV